MKESFEKSKPSRFKEDLSETESVPKPIPDAELKPATEPRPKSLGMSYQYTSTTQALGNKLHRGYDHEDVYQTNIR
jgi:hypothetical protein